jgi:hypothetical protein
MPIAFRTRHALRHAEEPRAIRRRAADAKPAPARYILCRHAASDVHACLMAKQR